MGDDIRGIENGNNSSIRYSQDKNANECIIRKAKTEMAKEIETKIRKEIKGVSESVIKKIIKIVFSRVRYLENCGVSAFSTLMEGIGVLGPLNYAHVNRESIQMDDFFSDYLNDPKKDNIFSAGDVFDNRSMGNYVRLVKIFFPEVDVVYKKFTWEEITEKIYNGWGAQMCLRTPGHYVAGTKYNKTKKLILYSDSWSGNKMQWEGQKLLRHGGWDEEMNRKMYEKNTVGYAIIYRKKTT